MKLVIFPIIVIYTNRETIQKKSVTIADILTDLDNYADKINNFMSIKR